MEVSNSTIFIGNENSTWVCFVNARVYCLSGVLWGFCKALCEIIPNQVGWLQSQLFKPTTVLGLLFCCNGRRKKRFKCIMIFLHSNNTEAAKQLQLPKVISAYMAWILLGLPFSYSSGNIPHRHCSALAGSSLFNWLFNIQLPCLHPFSPCIY